MTRGWYLDEEEQMGAALAAADPQPANERERQIFLVGWEAARALDSERSRGRETAMSLLGRGVDL